MPGNPNSLLSQGARVAFFLLRTLHRTADRQPASSSCFHFSSCSSYPPGPIQAGDQESQPTSRSQSKALSPLAIPTEGQPAVLTRPEHKGGSSGKPGDRVPQSCSHASPNFPHLSASWESRHVCRPCWAHGVPSVSPLSAGDALHVTE